MICDYKNILGKPKEGVHSLRFMNIAIVDFLLTILLGLFLARIFNINIFAAVLSSLLLGIATHRIFCVKTTINTLLFGN
jgi:hypothetical protein